VPPLISDVKDKLDAKKNPFFEHAERELFLARRGDEISGRIVGIVDHNHNSFHNEKIAFFGLYESLNDFETARAMLEAVAAWGQVRGMTGLRGTVNLSLNDECAFLLEGFESPPVVMMPYNPPYYLDLMAQCGMAKAKDLYAFSMTRDHETAQKVQAIIDKIKKETTVTCRSFNKKKPSEEAEIVKYVYNHAWEKNWGFVPSTDNEMNHMVKSFLKLADLDLVIIAEDRGKPVGFAFGLPNYNEILIKLNGRLFPFGIFKLLTGRKKIKGMRALVFGIVKDYRQSGTSYLLYAKLEENAVKKGYQWCEMSWQLEDNEPVNRFVASLGGKIYKKYRIYEKKIG
jgi:GNAT superfamily N-acetyltransferase